MKWPTAPRPLIGIITALLVLCQTAHAENWPHWRGPSGNGVASQGNPPTRWTDSENVKWKVAIPGSSSGSPVVWDDRVFVVSAIPVAKTAPSPGLPRLKFDVFCFSRDTGKALWQRTAIEATPHEETHSTNGFASASPCTDGEHVYASFGSQGLYCYTMDGELVWSRNDFGTMQIRNGFGEGSSPTIAGDMILLPWDHQGQSYLYALDKRTGKTVWQTPRDEPTQWSTPLVVTHNGRQQVIMNGENKARAYDLETGKELWSCGGQTQRPVASAVSDGKLVFVTSGFRGEFLGAFTMDGTGDIEGTRDVVWTTERDTPDIASPLLSGGRLYFHKGKSGLLTCLDAATGKPHFTASRVDGINGTYASPVAAGGHIYITDREGTVTVIEDATTLKVVAKNKMNEPVDASPAIADDQIFVRGANHLFCIGA